MTEFENKNSNRNYPFSSNSGNLDPGSGGLSADVFVDAILYPLGQVSQVKLSKIDFSSGSVTVTTDSGQSCSGVFDGKKIELFYGDLDIKRHFGTIMCGKGFSREMKSGRTMEFDDLFFAASCVVPVALNCVTSVYTDSGLTLNSPIIGMRGVGRLTVSTSSDVVDGELVSTVRFDVKPNYTKNKPVLRELVVVVKNGSLFSVNKLSDSSVLLTAGDLTREDVCYQAHKEDSVSSVYDTCSGESSEGMECNPCVIETDPCRVSISGNSISIQAFDLLNYRNPVKISTVGGTFSVDSPDLSNATGEDEAEKELSKLSSSQLGSGNGLKIEIPGAMP